LIVDVLAKELHSYLLAGGCTTPELRQLGWMDFIRFDLPDTEDARILAGIALHRLVVDAAGTQLNHDGRVVYATLAFAKAKRGGTRPPSALSRDLLAVLATPPITEERLIKWFLESFA
jgi:hypothetical protein